MSDASLMVALKMMRVKKHIKGWQAQQMKRKYVTVVVDVHVDSLT